MKSLGRILTIVLAALVIPPLALVMGIAWAAAAPPDPWPPACALAVLLLIAALASGWSFGSALPGMIGWCGGVAVVLVAWPGGLALAPAPGLSALLVAQAPLVLMLVALARAKSRRQGSDPGLPWHAMAGLLVACAVALASRDPDWLPAALVALCLLVWRWLADRIASLLLPVAGRWPADGWTLVNSLCGYGSFVLSCLTLPLFLPLALILPGGRERWIAAAMRRAMRFVFWVTPTITWTCEGELAALAGARVVVMNHEGMLDILAACALPGTRTLLAKSWVFQAFPLGVAARAAGLRNSDRLLPEDYQEGVAATLPDPGVGIFVFPEGSRSRSGEIGRFRPGAFVLAKSLGCPVVPVAIAGSRLGIRPGSLWIHPSLVVGRVLPPMALEPDETIRAFAARVRAAIVAARHDLLVGLLATPRMARNRRHFFTGLGPAARRAVAAEERTGAWRAVLSAPADDGDWLLIGCGWSTIPVTLRQLLPASRIVAWEPDAGRRAVARHAWFAPDSDALAGDREALALPERLAGIVCCVSGLDARARDLLGAAAPRLGAGLLLACGAAAGEVAAQTGRAAPAAPAGDWVVLPPR